MPDGKDVGKPIRMRDWQRKILEGIYDTPTRLAIISVGRKNSKTTTAAMLLLLHLVGPEARPNSELYSSALSRDQAAIIFRLASKMIRLSAELGEAVVIRDTVKQLHVPELGTLYSALSADASTNFGLSPVMVIHDELGQVKGERHPLYEALETATGAQADPLSIVISTQAPTDGDLLSRLIDDAKTEADPLTKLFLWTADPEADPFEDETIRQANPAFNDFQNAAEIRRMAQEAKRMPSREAAYRNLILNQRVEASNPFVTASIWQANGGSAEPGAVAFGGLDLSETSDLTAFVLVSRAADGWCVESQFWIPADGIEDRARRDRVPYDVWANEGHISATPGRSVEYEYVASHIARLFQTRSIQKIAFDSWNMRHLRPWLIRAGLPDAFIDEHFVEFRQGYISMSPALRTLETLLLNGRLRHGNHPVLTMCAANAVVKMDEAGNRKLDKKRSRGRIDGMVALAMACEVAGANLESPEGVVFRREWLEHWTKKPSGGNRYVLVQAASEKRKSAYTELVVVELREDQRYYVIDMVRDRLSLTERADRLFEMHREHQPLRVGYDEHGLEADEKHIRERQERENYRFTLTPLAGRLSADERIRRLVPLFEAKRIVLPESLPGFVDEEYLPYPLSAHVGLLDCLSRILDIGADFPAVVKYTPPAVFPSEW